MLTRSSSPSQANEPRPSNTPTSGVTTGSICVPATSISAVTWPSVDAVENSAEPSAPNTTSDRITPVKVVTDVVKGHYIEALHTFAYREIVWLLAQRGREAYIHRHEFFDNWELADAVRQRIEVTPPGQFDPSSSPHWVRICDTKPITPLRWWRIKSWWIEPFR